MRSKADAGPVEWQNNWCVIKAYGSWQRSISPLMRVVRAIGFENKLTGYQATTA